MFCHERQIHFCWPKHWYICWCLQTVWCWLWSFFVTRRLCAVFVSDVEHDVCQSLRGAFLWPEVWHGHYWHNYWPEKTIIDFYLFKTWFLRATTCFLRYNGSKWSYTDGKILKMSSMWWEPCQSGKWIPGWNVCWQRSPHIPSHWPLVCPSKSLTDQFLAGVKPARRLARLRLFVTVLNIQTPHSAPFLSL